MPLDRNEVERVAGQEIRRAKESGGKVDAEAILKRHRDIARMVEVKGRKNK